LFAKFSPISLSRIDSLLVNQIWCISWILDDLGLKTSLNGFIHNVVMIIAQNLTYHNNGLFGYVRKIDELKGGGLDGSGVLAANNLSSILYFFN
jgi:hypothetical protein